METRALEFHATVVNREDPPGGGEQVPGWKQGMFGLPAVGYGVSRTTADVCLLGAKTMADSRLSLGLWRLPQYLSGTNVPCTSLHLYGAILPD